MLSQAGVCKALSHGLVLSGATFWDILIDLRLPDLGRNIKKSFFPSRIHMLVPRTGTRLPTLNMLVAIHERQNRITPEHGIRIDCR